MTIYAQFCPVAKTTEVIAERWTPLILRELLCGSHRYGEIHAGVPRMSPSLLARRLKQLQRAGLVERRPGGDGPSYHLTAAGEELRPIIESLGAWGQRWMHQIADDELDPALLMVDVHRGIDVATLPDAQVVLHVRFTDAEPAERDWWLLLGPDEVDVCRTDRGFDVDLRLATDVRTLTEIWMGNVGLNEALRGGGISLTGPVSLQRRLHRWLGLNQFAHVPRAPRPLQRVARE
jgi:DNA-binding HxlR family transcriptional regulator